MLDFICRTAAAAAGALSAAESYPTSEVGDSGLERQAAIVAQEGPKGATPRPRSGAVAGRSNPTSKEWWLPGHRRA